MSKKLAAIGDLHGCIDELKELHKILKKEGCTEIWALGDLVDRGPDSAGVVEYCMKNKIKSVMGNHEQSILQVYDNFKKTGHIPKSKDKANTIQQLTDPQVEFLRKLPYLHVDDELKVILVHGGLYPKLPLYNQPTNVCRAQLIHPDEPGRSKWWGPECLRQNKKTEEELAPEGWVRWYTLYDFDYTVVFGHSVFNEPMIHPNELGGCAVGIDTGSVFGGKLTACIIEKDKMYFRSVQCKEYCPDVLKLDKNKKKE